MALLEDPKGAGTKRQLSEYMTQPPGNAAVRSSKRQ